MMDAYLWGEKLKEMLNEAIGLHNVTQADFLSQMIISAFDMEGIVEISNNLSDYVSTDGYVVDEEGGYGDYEDEPDEDEDFDEFEDENEAIARGDTNGYESVFNDQDEHDPDDQPWGDEDEYFNDAE